MRERAIRALEEQAASEQRFVAAAQAYNEQLRQQILIAQLAQETIQSLTSTIANIVAGFVSLEEGIKSFFQQLSRRLLQASLDEASRGITQQLGDIIRTPFQSTEDTLLGNFTKGFLNFINTGRDHPRRQADRRI